jgi:hypothetical protein
LTYHIAIDVSSVLRRTVCELYSNLVTRPTGATVRRAIEEALVGLPEPNVTVIDFSHVTLLDFSCADEIVGKLLDAQQRADGRPRTYFLIRGLHEPYLEAIEAVLERYDLAALVQDPAGNVHLVGTLDDGARRAWHVVRQRGSVQVQEIEDELGEPLIPWEEVVSQLSSRRLVVRRDDGRVALPQAS